MSKAYVQGIIDFGYGIYVSPYLIGSNEYAEWLGGQEVEARYTFSYYKRHWRQMSYELQYHKANKSPKMYQPVYDEWMINWFASNE